MKQLILATALLTSTVFANSVHLNSTIDDAPSKFNLEVLLTAFGVVDYYQSNCEGLTPRGQAMTMDVLVRSDLYLLTADELTGTKAFKNGYKTASKFSCNKLRTEVHNAGAVRMFR